MIKQTNNKRIKTGDPLTPKGAPSDGSFVTPDDGKVQLTLTQLLPKRSELKKKKETKETEEEENPWYDFSLLEMSGKKMEATFNFPYDPIEVVVPNFVGWTDKVDFDKGEEVLHGCVINTTARGMIFDKNTGDYTKHHQDPEFIHEYHMHVNGMIYTWLALSLPVLENLENNSPHTTEQYEFAKEQIPLIMNGLNKYNAALIGSLNPSYIMKHVRGLEAYENAAFVSYIANCTRFELYSDYRFKRGEGRRWQLYTKIYRTENENTEDVYNKPLKFTFGLTYPQDVRL